ncbi:hypothetical protein Patl1_22738 [Pistacia atlantica]|uniref:Uncharacterized protein n=1 Tax=Pistacia atlantica TaxID=434234 RepID=A0ACC1A3F5_9ROSI|nr:hypothetical protein Patl1_22738 [Pistacia atlantica]
MEEGLLPRSSVPETKSNTKSIADGDSSVTSVVVLSTLVSICGSFAYGCTAGYSSPAESGIMEDLQLSVAAYSVFGSLTTVGGIIGSFMNGIIPDLIGRKGTMWLSELLCIFGWLAIAFSKGAWLLDIGRLSTGIGAGMIAYVVPIYIAEITPKDVRGGFTQASQEYTLSSTQLMMTCGFSLMFYLGTIVSWRTLAFIGSVPCLLQVFGLFFIPESPRWLAKIGREKELETTLRSFRGKNADVSQEAADIKPILLPNMLTPAPSNLPVGVVLFHPILYWNGSPPIFYWSVFVSIQSSIGMALLQSSIGVSSFPSNFYWNGSPPISWLSVFFSIQFLLEWLSSNLSVGDYTKTFERDSEAGILNMFQRRYAYSLLIGVGLMALQQLGGSTAIGYYASSIFEEADFSTSLGTVSMAIILIPASCVSTLLIDKSGRRPLLLVSNSGMCLCFLIMALALCVQDFHPFKNVTPVMVYVCMMGYNIAMSLGMAGIPSVIMSEIFPINIKGSAGSLTTIVRWFFAFLSSYTFNFMMQWSPAGTFFIFAGICALAVLFVAVLVPETKDRTLEEIQASLTYLPE